MSIQMAFRSEYFSSAWSDLSRPKPGLLEAAERRGDVAVVEAVDPDDAGAQRSCEPMCTRDVARPDRGGEAVDRVVRDGDRLVLVDERDRGEDGAEDLLARDPHVVRDCVEDRRLDEVAAALRSRLLTAQVKACTLPFARLDVAEHALELRPVDERAHLRLGVERVAGADGLGDAHDSLEEIVLQRLVHEEPRAGIADLALVVEDAPGGGLGRGVQVGAVLHDDVRRLAAAFEREPLHVRLARVAEEELADLGRAGEGDEVDVHVQAERAARRSPRSPGRPGGRRAARRPRPRARRSGAP